MDGFIIGIIFVVGIVGLYFLTYILNKNTPVPDGVTPFDKCSTCGTGSCSLSRKEQVQRDPEQECDLFDEIREELRK